MTDQVRVSDNPGESRYEAWIGDERVGLVGYRLQPSLIIFSHTEVETAYEGEGVGSALARYVLDEARRRDLRVVPWCPFIRGWINRHPEYADLVVDQP